MSFVNKALKLLETKESIKNSLRNKEQSIPDTLPFSAYSEKIDNIQEVALRLSISQTAPINPKQGTIWVKSSINTLDKVFFTDILNTSDDSTVFIPNSINLYALIQSGDALDPVSYTLFDFGNNLKIKRDIAGSVLINNSGMQTIAEVYIYDVTQNQFIKIPYVQLPLLLSEQLNLGAFLGNEITVPSLYDLLGLEEELDIESIELKNTESINVSRWLGATLDIISLYLELGISEQVFMFKGGEQIYP